MKASRRPLLSQLDSETQSISCSVQTCGRRNNICAVVSAGINTHTGRNTGSPEKNSFFIFSKVVRHTDNHWRPLVQLVNAHAEQNAAVDGHNNVLQWGTLFCSQLASAHLYFWQTASKILFELPVMWLTCCQWTRWAESCFSSEPLSASDTCCCHQIQSERMLRLLT